MSPEQVRGDADLDGRSDVYALGVILFEMLTGRGPYQATTPLSVALKHLTEPLPSIRSFRPDLPMESEEVLNKAMAKDRELRYASALELARELQAISDTYQNSGTPGPIRIILPHGEEKSTEMDLDGDSPSDVFQSNADPSQIVSTVKALKPESKSQPSKPVTIPKESSRGNLPIASMTGLGLILLLLCGVIGLIGTWIGLGLPGFSQSQNQIVSPTPIVLFADDFSDPNSGWPTIQNVQGGYGYQQDGYHIFVNETNGVFWAKTNRQDDNISVYVDAKPVTEGTNGYYGLLCRIQDDQNFYYFVIRSNGDYTIGKYKKAEFLPFFDWRRSDAVKAGNQANRFRAECVDNTLRFYVNDVRLDEASDADFPSGFSGLVAASLDGEGFEVTFNNFLITKSDR
jgi:hypothetical protein